MTAGVALVAAVTFSVAAASSSPGEVVAWVDAGGVSSVSRSWEAPRDAGCRVVFLPGDEEPSDGDEDPGGLWASGAEPGYTSRMRDAAVNAGCGFSQLRTPDRVSGTWYKQGARNAAWIRSWVSAHTRPTDRVWFVGYSGGAQEFRYLTAAYAGRMPPGGAVLFGGGGPAGGGPAAAPAGHPADLAALAAGWRWPDGDLAPLPFGSTCEGCRARVEFRTLWCPPCDDKRITRIEQGFRDIAAAFEEAKA